MSKYYTPELGEITTSIRHEVSYNGTNDWYKHEGLATDPLAQYRVKYLDHDDITELKWVKDESYPESNSIFMGSLPCRYLLQSKKHLYTLEKDSLTSELGSGPIKVKINKGRGDVKIRLFHGVIKNYNELKTLIKWLKIV